MTAAAAEARGGKPSQVAEWRPSLGWGRAPRSARAPQAAPAGCRVPTLPRAKARDLRKPLGLPGARPIRARPTP